jgi:hypothetical protein
MKELPALVLVELWIRRSHTESGLGGLKSENEENLNRHTWNKYRRKGARDSK